MTFGRLPGSELLRRFFLETWQAMDAQKKRYAISYDFRPLITMIMLPACVLTVIGIGAPDRTPAALGAFAIDAEWGSPLAHAWWIGISLLMYLLIPVALITGLWREKLGDYGMAIGSLGTDAGICLSAFLFMLFCIVLVAIRDSHFLAYYPIYPNAARSWCELLTWELAYLTHLLAVEFFFRGFALNALRPALGSHAIFVTTATYAIAHLGKPLPESFGAIVAGFFLGTLAVRTGAIWSGFLIHAGVALSMDLAALLAKGSLPFRWY